MEVYRLQAQGGLGRRISGRELYLKVSLTRFVQCDVTTTSLLPPTVIFVHIAGRLNLGTHHGIK